MFFSHSINIVFSPIVVCDNPEDYPPSYRSNSLKEETILKFVENFRRQYHYIYRDRKPLFLNPLNECGIPVCFGNFLSKGKLFLLEIRLYNSSADDVTIFSIVSMEFSC